jgi:hypothetical protein
MSESSDAGRAGMTAKWERGDDGASCSRGWT